MSTAAAIAPDLVDLRVHLDAELRHLDLLLLRELGRFERAAADIPSHQGIYISREEVLQLLDGGSVDGDGPVLDASGDLDADADLLGATRVVRSRARLDARLAAAESAGVDFPIRVLARLAELSASEVQILVACLAPELDRRYDRVYAYLQDDLTRRRPSVDLVARLVSGDRHERWDVVGLLSENAPLLAAGLLRVVPDPASPSGSSALARLLQVAPSVLARVLGRTGLDPALAGSARLVEPDRAGSDTGVLEVADPGGRTAARVLRIVRDAPRTRTVVIHVHGAPGSGQALLARAVAEGLGEGHVELRCSAVPTAEQAVVVRAAIRDAWLAGRPLLLLDADVLLHPSGATRQQLLDAALDGSRGLVLTVADGPWPGTEPEGVEVHQVRLDPPGGEAGRRMWDAALAASGLAVGADWAPRLAEAVRLGPATVGDVAREVRDAAMAHEPATAGFGHWLDVARRRATERLEGLARPVVTSRGWADLVLDEDRTGTLHEICNYVRLRDVVLDDWGMATRAGVARGLSVLFSGPPGTGKTMSAGVIAAEMGLQLFVIDLSQVVSKYIGETEKNLAQVFDAAEASGAVLLFDEADALFGTRTEISDAHDRYANIETSYLLQRMEEYDGVAVLSSNLRQNIDEAFLRRLRFVVDFPLPDQQQRRQIWERHLGGGVPLAELDLDVLATRLEVAGGSIRNIALAAAFLAAAEQVPLSMDHLGRASRREFEKLGKLWRDPLQPASGSRPDRPDPMPNSVARAGVTR